MKEAWKTLILWSSYFVITICLFSFSAQAQNGSSEISASVETNTYVFLSEESTIVQTGGIAGVHWTYSVEGLLKLTLDPNTGTALFAYVDANATDDSPLRRALGPNEIFNMTSLAGTFVDDTTISFTGKAKDGSDVLVTVTIKDDLIYLVGETTPPPNSADFFLFSLDAAAKRKYGGGIGRPNDPYLIYTAEQMNEIGMHEEDWDKHFKLMADIDLSDYRGTDYNIIGYWVGLDSPENRPFRGVFDGNGHTISNFTYTCTDKSHIGLFGYIEGPDAAIKSIGLIDPNIDAGTEGWGIGSLVGYLREGVITDCYVEGGSVSGNEQVGGLLGSNWECPITNCYSTSNISGNLDVGGLAGDNVGTITNCYSRGSVSGGECVGGLVGFNWGTITNCYSTGLVEGAVDVGGLAGYGGGAIASFWDIETSGQLISAGGIGKTTAEMQMANTFVGWSFGQVWTIDEGKDYPRLWWEKEKGETPGTQQLSDFLTGVGTEDEPYLIYTAKELNTIGLFPNDWDKHFKLMADIDLADLTGTDFNIIGISPESAFTGVFDGNGRKISNFTYTSTEALNVGLFGYLKSTAIIKDLGLIEPYVYTGIDEMGGWGVGSLVGLIGDGTIISCYVEGGSVAGGWMVGSLVGYVENGAVTNCYVEGSSISGDEDVGGLVGFNQGIINSCYAISTISCNGGGGLVGTNWVGEITNCYSAGSVSGNKWAGGLVGFNLGTITTCYSASSVTATDMVGGLVGDNWGEVLISFWDIETSGQTQSVGGIGLTTTEMQTESTFTDAGWDFVDETANGTKDIWWIDEGNDYPRLYWEQSTDDMFFLVVDDFESYSDLIAWPDTKSIFNVWRDGFGDPENGAFVGYFDHPFCEQTIVHGGNQSMPFFYDNSAPANYSEATAKINNLEIGRDWTIEGVEILSLWLYGDPNNTPEPMYIALNGNATTFYDNQNALLIEDWMEWTIDLQELADQDTDLTNINTISIGFGDKNNPSPSGGKGKVLFDDIRLYRPEP